MSEGAVHRRLVQVLSMRIRLGRSQSWMLFVDGGSRLDTDGCPPSLERVRPDVYARENVTKHVIIGEAKTAKDLDNDHTLHQLVAYFQHLALQQSGELVMAVPFHLAGAAHRLCNLARRLSGAPTVPFVITGWMFGSQVACEAWDG